MHHTVIFGEDFVYYTLPLSKVDKFGQGNKVLVCRTNFNNDCLELFRCYLHSRDSKFPHTFQLGLGLWCISSKFLQIEVSVDTPCGWEGQLLSHLAGYLHN